jgi:DNA uptake protein ComE-like DNA-binding protein
MRTPRLLAVIAIAAIFGCALSVSFAQRSPGTVQTVTDPLDINTATARQLKALPGFGDAYVQRVIAGRPYTAKNQLVTRGVLPQSAYDQVASRIIAHRPPK